MARALLGAVKEGERVAVKLAVRALRHSLVDNIDALEIALKPLGNTAANFLTITSFGG